MSLRIVALPPGSRIVAAPKFGGLAHGIPPGGPFDERSFMLANKELGNSPEAPVLEMLNTGFRCVVEGPGNIVVAGAKVQIDVDGQPQKGPSSIAKVGQTVDLLPEPGYARVYIAMPGGVHGTLEPGAPISGRDTCPQEELAIDLKPVATESIVAARWAPTVDLAPIPNLAVKVHPRSDRHGVRLMSDSLGEHPHRIRSEPQCVGAIEWAPSGEWIVIGPDGPTIGGYPRIGWIVRASMPAIAQAMPGATLRIRWVDEAEERRLNVDFDLDGRAD